MKHSELRHQPRHVNPRIQAFGKRLQNRCLSNSSPSIYNQEFKFFTVI